MTISFFKKKIQKFKKIPHKLPHPHDYVLHIAQNVFLVHTNKVRGRQEGRPELEELGVHAYDREAGGRGVTYGGAGGRGGVHRVSWRGYIYTRSLRT